MSGLLLLCITPGQSGEIANAPAPLECQRAEAVLVDKAYDGNEPRDRTAAMNATAIIPLKRNCGVAIPDDPSVSKMAIRSSDASAGSKHFR